MRRHDSFVVIYQQRNTKQYICLAGQEQQKWKTNAVWCVNVCELITAYTTNIPHALTSRGSDFWRWAFNTYLSLSDFAALCAAHYCELTILIKDMGSERCDPHWGCSSSLGSLASFSSFGGLPLISFCSAECRIGCTSSVDDAGFVSSRLFKFLFLHSCLNVCQSVTCVLLCPSE